VIAVTESKQVYFDEATDEKFMSISHNIMDINMKTGQGTVKGYGISMFPNGDKNWRTHEGKPVGKGHWKGTWSFVKGTGQWEGVTGGGTWDSYSIGPQTSYYEVEGDMERPGQ